MNTFLGLLYTTRVVFFESGFRFGFGFNDTHHLVAAPFELRLQGGINVDDGVALTLGSTQTLIGPRRNPWVIDLGLTILFGSPPKPDFSKAGSLKQESSTHSNKQHDHDHEHEHEHDHGHLQ